MRKFFTYGLLLLIPSFGIGQNLDKIGKEDAVKVSGGVSFNTITYLQQGLITPSREPFTWFASGNININIIDVSLPFTFSLSNQGGQYTQPFNRTALHPEYKWFKSHIGLISMNFSPYTLSGHLFLGGGIEMTPGKWNIQAMGGRLNKAIQYDPNDNNPISYNRFGYGVKVGYEDKGYGGELIIFKANDSRKSLSFVPINSEIKPQDNIVFSLKGKAKIFKDLFVDAEYAISGLTQNLNDIAQYGDQVFISKMINGNATTDYFNAFNSSLTYSYKSFSIAASFEHIDPGYKTLGGYYFNNDLQNYTLAPSLSLFKNKLNFSVNSGFQRNNLGSTESATTNRWIGSANISFVPSSKLILNGSYSNFSTYTRNRPISDPFFYLPADTLNFYQLTQSASTMISYNFGEGDTKHVLQLMYNYMESTSLSGNVSAGGAFGLGVQSGVVGVPTKVHMGNIAYTLQFKRSASSLSLVANINQSYIPDQNSTFFGPTANFQKSLFDKKASLSLGTTYNRQLTNSILSSNILNHRISFSYSPKFKNEKVGQASISLNANLLQRFATNPVLPNIFETNIFLNLNYSF